jgi:hypothetical protein
MAHPARVEQARWVRAAHSDDESSRPPSAKRAHALGIDAVEFGELSQQHAS